MSNWINICKLDDLTPFSGNCVLVNGEQIALFRLDEGNTVKAIHNYDPIGKANVLSRGLIAGLDGKITVASPLYKQHYCLDSGQCIQDEDVSVPVYSVNIDDDGTVSIAA